MSPAPNARVPLFTPLTPTEEAVVKLIAEGWSVKQVATGLGVAVRTTRVHVLNASRKIPGTVPALTRIVMWARGKPLGELHAYFHGSTIQHRCQCQLCRPRSK